MGRGFETVVIVVPFSGHYTNIFISLYLVILYTVQLRLEKRENFSSRVCCIVQYSIAIVVFIF